MRNLIWLSFRRHKALKPNFFCKALRYNHRSSCSETQNDIALAMLILPYCHNDVCKICQNIEKSSFLDDFLGIQ